VQVKARRDARFLGRGEEDTERTMGISAEQVKELREITGAPLMDCKKALAEADGDPEKAQTILRERGIAVLAKRDSKTANEGIIAHYIHTGSKIGVMLELNCETDFVAKTDEFKQLGHDLAMQIAWSNPRYKERSEIPEEVVEKEREVHTQWAKNQGKPDKAIPKIVEGRLEKFFESECLMDQAFVKDDKLKVRDLINEKLTKLGEKIVLRRFLRFRVGEESGGGAKAQDS
jgi:elongation factor Ts